MGMAKASLDLFVMSCWLSIAVLLLSVYHARAQGGVRECERITIQDLRSRDNFLQNSILVQTYNPNVNPTNPFIVVDDMHIVCEAPAATRDRYRYVSVVVRQTCSGSLCTTEEDVLTDVQYDFECSTSNEWIAESFGRNMKDIREDDPEADFDTEPLCNCKACAADLAGADSVTHCLPCSGCDEGLMLCDGRLGICCTYYFEDGCVEECPEESHVVDKDFNCVEPVECPALQNPTNGTVTYDERVYPNEAVYECEDGFELSGGATRKCQIDGEWSGDAPECDPESNSSKVEIGIIVAVVVLFFLIVAGVFIALVAIWACKH